MLVQDALWRGGETCLTNVGGLIRKAIMRSFEIHVGEGPVPRRGLETGTLGRCSAEEEFSAHEDFSVQ